MRCETRPPLPPAEAVVKTPLGTMPKGATPLNQKPKSAPEISAELSGVFVVTMVMFPPSPPLAVLVTICAPLVNRLIVRS